ncbi:hypothetical protein SNE40_005027 [Patella caerulea]
MRNTNQVPYTSNIRRRQFNPNRSNRRDNRVLLTNSQRQMTGYNPRRQQQLLHQRRPSNLATPNYLTAPTVMKLMQFINKYRAEVDAANMLEMRWSNQLANRAAQRSKTCQFSHLYDTQGESLILVHHEITGTNMVDYIMNEWYGEKNTFRREHDCRQTKSCNYSQMIWATSRHIGCASHICAKHQLVVCLFSPAGNRYGVQAYIKGNHCEMCPGRCRNQLCMW